MQQHYDIVVVGGGMTGAAMALGLARSGWSAALLEHQPAAVVGPDTPPGLRVSALSCTSVELLKQLAVWPAVEQMRCAPWRRLETWEQHGSEVIFDAASLALPELGFMVENSVLQSALWQQLACWPDVDLLCPARLLDMEKITTGWKLTLDNGQQLQTRLVIGADGAHSVVRRLAGIGSTGWHYRQACLLVSVETETPAGDITWQQFFHSGPRAFLPLTGHQASLVWYDSPARIRQLQMLPLPALNAEITRAFPARLNTVHARAAGSFPLLRHHAQRYVQPGLVLLGDAAHTIHPLAGQGVNLGYRDLRVLLEVLNGARTAALPWESEALLLTYQHRRRADNLLMQSAMDFFYATFSNDNMLLKRVRHRVLTCVQRSDWIKKQALKYALGW